MIKKFNIFGFKFKYHSLRCKCQECLMEEYIKNKEILKIVKNNIKHLKNENTK